MIRKSILIAALAAAGTLAACTASPAADMPRHPPAKAYAPAPAFSWTGFYFGAHAGYGWSETDHATPGMFGFSLSSNPSGDDFLYGVKAEALYEFPGTIIVAGIAADYSWGKLSGSSVINLNGPAPCGPCGPLAGTSYKVSLDEIGTAKGVLGLSMGRLLPYLTAGVAFAEGNATASFTGGGGGGSISASDDLRGWTFGGGFKWAMTERIMLGVDYSYMRFDGNYAFNFPAPFAALAVTAGGETKAHLVKGELLAKF